MGSTKQTEQDKHKAGGPGKASRKGHIDSNPETSGNKPGQHQTERPRGPGEGGTGGTRVDRNRLPE
jgi:hypothetical protein